ncbi:hypothetical protein Q3G72_000738 [Acer saccharum]|nr:hypothetical protein Q3G72_000738 [Acer saccharum]
MGVSDLILLSLEGILMTSSSNPRKGVSIHHPPIPKRLLSMVEFRNDGGDGGGGSLVGGFFLMGLGVVLGFLGLLLVLGGGGFGEFGFGGDGCCMLVAMAVIDFEFRFGFGKVVDFKYGFGGWVRI